MKHLFIIREIDKRAKISVLEKTIGEIQKICGMKAGSFYLCCSVDENGRYTAQIIAKYFNIVAHEDPRLWIAKFDNDKIFWSEEKLLNQFYNVDRIINENSNRKTIILCAGDRLVNLYPEYFLKNLSISKNTNICVPTIFEGMAFYYPEYLNNGFEILPSRGKMRLVVYNDNE